MFGNRWQSITIDDWRCLGHDSRGSPGKYHKLSSQLIVCLSNMLSLLTFIVLVFRWHLLWAVMDVGYKWSEPGFGYRLRTDLHADGWSGKFWAIKKSSMAIGSETCQTETGIKVEGAYYSSADSHVTDLCVEVHITSIGIEGISKVCRLTSAPKSHTFEPYDDVLAKNKSNIRRNCSLIVSSDTGSVHTFGSVWTRVQTTVR